MNQLMRPGTRVTVESGVSCVIEEFLGGGGQGEVYRAKLDGKDVAVKWYFPEQATPSQRTALKTLLERGAPSDRFLWPMGLVDMAESRGFGYVMPLREKRYKGIVDLMRRRTDPTFRTLATVGFELAHSFLLLHTRGWCYRDISFGNVFFDPRNGEVLICDNDNVTVNQDGAGGVLGTPRFMAPEVVRGEAVPSTETDLFSLAVLLFYILMMHHPLEGKRESEIKCFDEPAMNRLYGLEPLFIFDPSNDDNRPVKGFHDNALAYWPIYPQFIRDLFTRAFVDGIRDPRDGRVRESEWRQSMVRMRDSAIYCGACGAENFYDMEQLKTHNHLNPCWACKKNVTPPPRIRIENQIVMLNHDTRLFPHHIDPQRNYDFSAPVAEVSRHPSDPNVWGLKNLSEEKWTILNPDGSIGDIDPGRNVSMKTGIRVQFGKVEGEIRS